MKLLLASALLAVGFSTAQLARSQVTGQLLAPDVDVTVQGVTKKIRSNDSKANSPIRKLKSRTDIGILSGEEDTPTERHLSSCPLESTVVCYQGLSLTGGSCQAACDNQCCSGEQACDAFTGAVCKDGKSCFGFKACANANITSVFEGCNGDAACYNAGKGGTLGLVHQSCHNSSSCQGAAYVGTIAAMHNSCIGGKACYDAASYYINDSYGGTIGTITDSCLGEKACYGAAYDYSAIIGDITSSCVGDLSCNYAAAYGGRMGNILTSCRQESACNKAAYAGTIGDVANSCVGNFTCNYAASYGGMIGEMTNSCHQDGACNSTAACYDIDDYQCGSKITRIFESCDGQKACFYSASEGGYINGIRNACNDLRACFQAASGGGSITFGINECCNGLTSSCANIMTNDDLPGMCSVGTTLLPTQAAPSQPPTVPPTLAPSQPPTKRPTAAPSTSPTKIPTLRPTASPSGKPTPAPTNQGTNQGSSRGTMEGTTDGTKAKKAKKHKAAKQAKSLENLSYPYSIKRNREHNVGDAPDLPANLRSGSDQQRT